jgi:hypothetical protein
MANSGEGPIRKARRAGRLASSVRWPVLMRAVRWRMFVRAVRWRRLARALRER